MSAERIILERWPGATRAFTRARLRDGDAASPLTPIGMQLETRLNQVPGCDIGSIARHYAQYSNIHSALWSDDEIDEGVVGAFRDVLGVDDLDVVREERRAEGDAVRRSLRRLGGDGGMGDD